MMRSIKRLMRVPAALLPLCSLVMAGGTAFALTRGGQGQPSLSAPAQAVDDSVRGVGDSTMATRSDPDMSPDTTRAGDDMSTTTVPDDGTTSTTAPDDETTPTTVPDDETTPTTVSGEDLSGPCDELEHADDPRCAPTADPDPSDPSPSSDNSGSGNADDADDHVDNSGPGNADHADDGNDGDQDDDHSGRR